MEIGKVGIDKDWTVQRLREFADKLDADFFGNLYIVTNDLTFFADTLTAKINAIIRDMAAERVKEYCERVSKAK